MSVMVSTVGGDKSILRMPEWETIITDVGAVTTLGECFARGGLIDDAGKRWLNEEEVGRIGSLKISVFSNEHPPPHFRVSYQGETANYRISDCAKLNGGLDRFNRNIKKWHAVHKPMLIDTWNETRPNNCPVGRYRE